MENCNVDPAPLPLYPTTSAQLLPRIGNYPTDIMLSFVHALNFTVLLSVFLHIRVIDRRVFIDVRVSIFPSNGAENGGGLGV
jgi:hypothetical protein